MKKLVSFSVFTLLALTLFVGFLLIFNPAATDAQSVTGGSDPEIARAIDDFWRYSRENDPNAVKLAVTSVPANYFEMRNHCEEKAGKLKQPPENAEPGIYLTKYTVTPSDNPLEYRETMAFARYLNKTGYRSYKIDRLRKSGDHALVRVLFAEEDKYYYDPNFFLLKRTNDGWKVFGVATEYSLSDDNPYFAGTSCSERFF